MVVAWGKTATKIGLVSYYFTGGAVLLLKREPVQVEKCACGSNGSSTAVTLGAAPLFFLIDQGRVIISAIRHDYDEYRCLILNPEPANYVYLDTIFDQDLLRTQPGDSLKLSGKILSAIGALMKEANCALPVSQKGDVDLVESLAGEVEDARQKSKADQPEVSGCDGKSEEVNLKV